MADLLRYDEEDGVATLTMDDGKANALSVDMSTALGAALDQAQADARVVVLAGRSGIFCGGFDLKLIQGDDVEARERMRDAGFDLLRRLYLYPLPIVAACTGHAIAGGALLLLTADLRLGAAGEFKIGLNEVAIGRSLPPVALELARDRLSSRHLTEAILHARLYAPDAACEAGFLDTLVEPDALAVEAQSRARAFLDLDADAFSQTKTWMREATAARMAD
ncbi:MAG: crotonase/enoyl-CoA hydratase family protein [Pseudomonadota bacterium]